VGSVVFLKIQIKAAILMQQIVSTNRSEIEKGQKFLGKCKWPPTILSV
jgi:hypothetical protein